MSNNSVSSMELSAHHLAASGASQALRVGQNPASALAPRAADVLLHHLPASDGETLHIYVDGEYFRAIDLTTGSAQTDVHIGTESWRTTGAVHAIDAYQASASGRVLEHQSVLVTTSTSARMNGVGAHCTQGSTTWAPTLEAEVHLVEYRISREGLPFGPWHSDYQEPAADGRDDGGYVVQMRFLDAQQRILDVQTVAFVVRDGMVVHA